MQEAFTKAWRALPKFVGERRFYPWLTVIAGNVCTDILRRRSRLTPVDDVPLPLVDVDSRDVDELVLREVDTKMVVQALGRLSDRHQRVLQLREGSGWTTRQIAEHEGVAVPAMETLLWRARQALKREFTALAETGGRLGIALGLGLVALRRFAYRTTARVADRAPVLQSVRGPGVLAASLVVVVAGGVVAGVATSGRAGPVDRVTMPTAAASTALPAAPSSVLGAPVAAGSGQPVGPATAAATNQPAGPVAGSISSAAAAATAPAGAVPAPAASPGTSPANRSSGLTAPSLPGATSAAGQVGSTVSSAVGNVGSAVSGVVSGAGSTASSVVGSVGSAVGGAVGGAGSTASSVVGSASSTVSSIVTDLAGSLGQVVGGLVGPPTP